MAGRAADERDDGRRGHAPARVPRRARRAAGTERSAAWIRSQQRADGTWTNFYGGPGDLSTTIEAYWALRLAGDPPEAEHMRIAAELIREQGGVARARVFTHLWLALFGLWSWDRVPALPPEVDPAAVVGAAQRLRLRLLGAPDDRRAVARQSPPAGAPTPVRALASSTPAVPTPAPSARARCCVFDSLHALLRAPPASARCSAWRSPAPSAGSCAARRPTARGAASSRRGCTR